MKQLLLTINGLVQGVGFRWFIRRVANQLGLTGWVRNNPDGTVSVCAEGEEGKLLEFLEICRSGPFGAEVGKVVETWTEVEGGNFVGFEIDW